MKVKNILVYEKEKYIDLVIKELIKDGISYVQIDNELHFDDYIFKFYDINDKILDSMMKSENILSIYEENKNIEYIPHESTIYEKVNHPRINKKKIKKQNKIINKKINIKKR